MRAVVQRVLRASVSLAAGADEQNAASSSAASSGAGLTDEKIVGEIARGLLVLLAVSKHDSAADAEYIAQKVLAMRVFDDAAGKMNVNVADAGGSVLVVSQFTLYGDLRKGRRPAFDLAAAPEAAEHWYEDVVRRIRDAGVPCATGRFRAMMHVSLVNDGPVTILLDSSRAF